MDNNNRAAAAVQVGERSQRETIKNNNKNKNKKHNTNQNNIDKNKLEQ